MRKRSLGLAISAAVFMASTMGMASAMTADEVIAEYHKNIGGEEAWQKINGMKLTGELIQGPMKFPFELVQLRDGRQYFKFEVQGKTLKQQVFDGKQLWNTNFMTMKAELSDAESTSNFMLNMNDFPDAFVGYKTKGYQLEMLGEETIDGTDTYKLKLTKEPVKVDGVEQADISFFYFDKAAMVPILQEEEIKSGQGKGMISQTKPSDYQEVNGLFLPFSIAQGVKGGPSAPMQIKKVEFNPSVDAAEFVMPKAE